MKNAEKVKLTEFGASIALKELMHLVPGIRIQSEVESPLAHDEGYDMSFEVSHNETPYKIFLQVKHNSEPRRVREAIWRLKQFKQNSNRNFVSVIAASYLSQQSQKMCEEADVSYLDMMGNARLAFGSIYIEKSVAETPKSEARALRSLFTPKSARILSIMMMNDPQREWRVTELAETADVSLGHVSNIRKRLLLREWAEERENGITLSNPDKLLDVWRERHPRRITQTLKGYTHLHGTELNQKLRSVLSPGHNGDPLAVCAGSTAAQWIAPYERSSKQSFYADDDGTTALVNALDLSMVSKGANVSIQLTSKDKVLPDILEAAEGIFCTNWLQTYLDLWKSNERSQEAADFLREVCAKW